MKIHLTAAESDENTFLKGMIVTIAFVSTKSTCLQCVRGSHWELNSIPFSYYTSILVEGVTIFCKT